MARPITKICITVAMLTVFSGAVALAQDFEPKSSAHQRFQPVAGSAGYPLGDDEPLQDSWEIEFHKAYEETAVSDQGSELPSKKPARFAADDHVDTYGNKIADQQFSADRTPRKPGKSEFVWPSPAGYEMPSFDGSAGGNTGFQEKHAPQENSSSSEDNGLIWWPPLVTLPLYDQNETESTTSDQLLHTALYNSPRIQAISKDPLIREMQVIEADAKFDPAVFARQLYDDRTDPVGNTFTTGGPEFLKDNIWTGEAGIRTKLRRGGELEVGQKFGFQNSNSLFFVPQDQGTTTLAINYSQPLLRNAGQYVNRSQILIAQSAGGIAWDVFSSELQQELERVISSYWQLYFDRSVFLQKKRNVERGQKILDMLTQRQDLDSLPSQIVRAKASVLSRETDLANAYRDVRDAETAIRLAVGQRDWLANQTIELLPLQHPIVAEFDMPLDQVVYTALDNRPEIRESVRRTKIAAVQLDVSANEILPELTLLLGTYVSALDEDSGVFRAWQKQFTDSTPGFSFGLEFEVPYKRRAARSRWTQSKLQVSKLQHELDENIQQVIAESQIAYRRVRSALETLKAAFTSITAAAADLNQQQMRWETFALIEGDVGDGQSPTTILDQLLDAQERLTAAELIYSQTLLDLQVAVVALNRATGTLLMHENVSYYQTQDGWIPNLQLERFTTPSYVSPPKQPAQASPPIDVDQLKVPHQEKVQPREPVDVDHPNVPPSPTAAQENVRPSPSLQVYPLDSANHPTGVQ